MMQITRSKIQYLPTTILILVGVLVWMFSFSGAATAFDFHADSAHGNNDPAPGYGVNRSGTGYSTGDCAHCHDTFDPSVCVVNETMLFVSPNDETLCFQCHKGAGSVQEGGIINYNYGGEKFGGGPNDFSNVCDAFGADASGGSSHDPAALLTWAETNHPEWGFTSSSNPCTICHNPHKDKENWQRPQDPTYTAIRRPSEHASNPGNLWGDDTGERMDSIWSAYRPPYYKSIGNDGYEPGGTPDHVGTKHPDYSTLCLDCHSEKSVNGRSGIDWRDELARPNDTWAPIHGEFPTNVQTNFHPEWWYGNPKLPWESANDYVLSCLDCHEPHGSSNPHMLRTTVNGVSGLTYDRDDNSSVQAWCDACHVLNTFTQEQEDFCRACHYIGSSIAEVYDNGEPFHFSFVAKPKCIDCHTHAPNITIGPHGDYEPDDDVCASCHRAAHT